MVSAMTETVNMNQAAQAMTVISPSSRLPSSRSTQILVQSILASCLAWPTRQSTTGAPTMNISRVRAEITPRTTRMSTLPVGVEW